MTVADKVKSDTVGVVCLGRPLAPHSQSMEVDFTRSRGQLGL